MVLIDLYKRGEGVIKKFPSVATETEAKQVIEKYCLENDVKVVGRERCGESHWNYLSDGTEIDYCIE